MSARNSLVLFFSILCHRAHAADCASYRHYVENPTQRALIIDWADKQIFSKDFLDDKFSAIGLAGPGHFGLSKERSGVTMPKDLSRDEVRFVGPNKIHPETIFIGHKAYQGLIITREQSVETWAGEDTHADWFGPAYGRISVMCYSEP